MCALILTMCNTTSSSSLSGFVKIGNGVFQGAQGGSGTGTGDGAALDVWGWCVLGVDPWVAWVCCLNVAKTNKKQSGM